MTGNFSIKPPPSSGRKGKGKTKTGFNSKSLKFEPGTVILLILHITSSCLEYYSTDTVCCFRTWSSNVYVCVRGY